jgi:hypothetical protein
MIGAGVAGGLACPLVFDIWENFGSIENGDASGRRVGAVPEDTNYRIDFDSMAA